MKMCSGLFWGVILIIIGLSLVIKIIFNIDFPIFKIVLAFIFIYIGLKIMFGSSFRFHCHTKTQNDVVFGETNFNTVKNGAEYNVVFSKGNFDFTKAVLDSTGPTKIKIHTVFGESKITIPRDMPVRIEVNAVFSGAHLPNGEMAAFGSSVYTSDSLDVNKPYLDIKADIVFSGLQFVSS